MSWRTSCGAITSWGFCRVLPRALLFYHPAVWWISGLIRVEREVCCDDLAAWPRVATSFCMRGLWRNSNRFSPASLRPALAANGGSLVNRIRRLIEPAQSVVDALPGPAAAWAMVLLWVAGLGVAAAQASQPHVRAAHLIEVPPRGCGRVEPASRRFPHRTKLHAPAVIERSREPCA